MACELDGATGSFLFGSYYNWDIPLLFLSAVPLLLRLREEKTRNYRGRGSPSGIREQDTTKVLALSKVLLLFLATEPQSDPKAERVCGKK